MLKKDFYYDLPPELIAQFPIEPRDSARLLVFDRKSGEIKHRVFTDVIDYMNSGDVLVVNKTKVLPARLFGKRASSSSANCAESETKSSPTKCDSSSSDSAALSSNDSAVYGGAKVEILLLKRIDLTDWEVLVKPGKRFKVGAKIDFCDKLSATIIKWCDDGNRIIRFEFDGVFEDILSEIGEMPLPHYIHEQLQDKDRYQTVYAQVDGSSAAPTAGLHFTPALMERIRQKGVIIAEVVLHVGLGTFRPVKEDNILDHKMHSEYYSITRETADIINTAKSNGNKVIAVGTTSVRVLESVANTDGKLQEQSGFTEIFIYPPYKFKVVDKLITNFHLPESTLLMLVSALCSREQMLQMYHEAVEEKYRFFSFGDATIII